VSISELDQLLEHRWPGKVRRGLALELADLSERDPARYRRIVSEALAEAGHQEHAENLLDMFQNAAQHRQEQDRELLDLLHGGGDCATLPPGGDTYWLNVPQ
jgi:hypothetical protein